MPLTQIKRTIQAQMISDERKTQMSSVHIEGVFLYFSCQAWKQILLIWKISNRNEISLHGFKLAYENSRKKILAQHVEWRYLRDIKR